MKLLPGKQRRFAVDVVRKLRAAGYEAYWAGGCVRDQLLNRQPKDYDVATNATPADICRVFRPRRTLAVGAAFGVITVLGPRNAGQVEVATFRRDAAYSDGRHPDGVTFSSAREDAARRDFTINGLFYDPLDPRVIDFVGGQEDLQRRVIRTIGSPEERFGEDKLRLLRAVRFSATFDFALEANTLEVIRRMADEIVVVSPERIAEEMHRMLVDANRAKAVRLLLDCGLAAAVLPEVLAEDDDGRRRFDGALAVLGRLQQPSFPLALGALLDGWVDPAGAEGICRRWRLSNRHTDRVRWLVAHRGLLEGARSMRWSALQQLLIAEGIEELLALEEAVASAGRGDAAAVEYCRSLAGQPREVLDPAPLLTGSDLIRHGVCPGPAYRSLLRRVRGAQLDGEIHSLREALALVDRLIEEGGAAQD